MKSWHIKMNGGEFKLMRLQDAAASSCRTVDTPERAYNYIQAMLPESVAYRSDVENFGVILLTTRKIPIGMQIVSTGTLDTILVHPREVFRAAIVMNAAGIVLWHNHPSGDPSPSDSDVKVTRDLQRGGQLMRIDICDHLVVGLPSPERPSPWVSMRELGYFSI